MTDTPESTEPFEFDPKTDQDWNADEHGSMADHATDDDEVEMEDPDTVYPDEETE